jgi:hypothetical protein
MAEPGLIVKKGFLQNCLNWFKGDFRQSIASLVETQFPNYALPAEVQLVLKGCEQIWQLIEGTPSELVDLAPLLKDPLGAGAGNTALFKQIVLRYRRHRAAQTEGYREKTFHAGIIQTLEEEINSLDALVGTEWFQKIGPERLPRAKDFLPIQYIEQSMTGQSNLAPRQYDEKFHILQAPGLFLSDLACFRSRCEVREAPITVVGAPPKDSPIKTSLTAFCTAWLV